MASPPPPENLDPPFAVPLVLPPPQQPHLQPEPQPPSSRRLPPPCWTPDETAALIDAYREKWYSLSRGNLRAAHWQEVADEIHRVCPDVLPPKTAVQCRHKMEKLRKRYRADLQRAKSIPHHRFSSSWVYFNKMDAMEKGDSIVAVDANNINEGFDNVVCVDDEDGGDYDEGNDGDEDFNGGFVKEFKEFQRNGLRIRIANSNPNPNPKKMNYGGFDYSPSANPNPNPSLGFGGKKFNEFDTPPRYNEGVRYATRIVKNEGFNGGGGSGSGGVGSSSGMGMGMNISVAAKKKRSALGKRERDRESGGGGSGVGKEMVEAIRLLGEGFMHVERMKMDMVRESERVRMENELKRTQMILESQQQLVEAFAKGWADLIVNNNDNNVGNVDVDDEEDNVDDDDDDGYGKNIDKDA
ncbi:unnamed protein product [Amaranthus hypochondriacus]